MLAVNQIPHIILCTFFAPLSELQEICDFKMFKGKLDRLRKKEEK